MANASPNTRGPNRTYIFHLLALGSHWVHWDSCWVSDTNMLVSAMKKYHVGGITFEVAPRGGLCCCSNVGLKHLLTHYYTIKFSVGYSSQVFVIFTVKSK